MHFGFQAYAVNPFLTNPFAATPFGGVVDIGGGGGDPAPDAPTINNYSTIDIGNGLVGTVATATPGTWNNADTVTGQWQCLNSTDWLNLTGETGINHTLTEADAALPIRYLETATNAGGSTQEPSNAETPAELTPPSATGSITIAWQGDGSGYVGDVLEITSNLSVDLGNPPATEITPSGWYRDVTFVDTGSTHTIIGADAGLQFRWKSQRLANSQGELAADQSNELVARALAAPNATGVTPTASRTSGILHCDAPNLGNEPVSPTYEWYRYEDGSGSSVIGTGNDFAYADPVGFPLSYLWCLVTWTNSQGSESAQSTNVIA